MKMVSSQVSLVLALALCLGAAQVSAYYSLNCSNKASRCHGLTLTCPYECPSTYPQNPNDKACYVDCDSPICKAECKHRKPNCDGPGAACYDPRFIGGDGIVFYFHGKNSEHFSLVSDKNLQINSRFIGHRPEGRTRDFTWIQALGLLFKTHQFTLEATTTSTWDSEVDHLKLSYNGNDLALPEGHMSSWYSPEKDIKVERISSKNGLLIKVKDTAEISVNVVPVTEQDDKIHKYRVPSDDCFAHLEVQFKFFALSTKVEGVLGRTYQPDFQNPAKPGVAMPVVGGEDKYRTSSLLASDCETCGFSVVSESGSEDSLVIENGTMDCTRGASAGYGIVCRK